jgi:hypothetical protein
LPRPSEELGKEGLGIYEKTSKSGFSGRFFEQYLENGSNKEDRGAKI